MNSSETTVINLRTGIIGAAMTIVGILLSGPLGLLAVSAVHPSPPWQGAGLYVQNYHPVQMLPFFGGFLLVSGYIVMMAALHLIAEARHKANTLIAVMFTAIFATLIFINYINQTTFVPALARSYTPAADSAISTFSLANPLSLSWAIEMWGYAALGVATWLAAGVFNGDRLERTTAAFMIANGVVSIVGGIVTSINLGWVLTPPGVVSYAAWNVLVLALSILVVASLRRRQKAMITTAESI